MYVYELSYYDEDGATSIGLYTSMKKATQQLADILTETNNHIVSIMQYTPNLWGYVCKEHAFDIHRRRVE